MSCESCLSASQGVHTKSINLPATEQEGEIWVQEDFPDYPVKLLAGRMMSQEQYEALVRSLVGTKVEPHDFNDVTLGFMGYRNRKDYAFQEALFAAAGPDMILGEKGVWLREDFPPYGSDLVKGSQLSKAQYEEFKAAHIGHDVEAQRYPDEDFISEECSTWKEYLLPLKIFNWD